MEAATVAPEQAEQNGAPVEGAEATRSTEHLFEYSRFVHIGEGAEECEHREDGKCENPEHFHAWLRLPNALQRQDILEKAKAAKARRRRALKDPESDANAIMESELDDLLAQDRDPLLKEIAEREARKGGVERVGDLIDSDERFENYWQDMEELGRLEDMPEEERPAEEYAELKKLSEEFDATLERQQEELTERELAHLRSRSEEELREICREVRIAGEGADAHMRSYYLWMGFVCTQKPLRTGAAKRVFERVEDYRNASPEVVRVVESTLRDLEARLSRGDAPGNS